jgi:hypothetical protein
MTDTVAPRIRNARQANILPQAELDRTRCIVIGLGAVGYNLAKMLAAMGVGKLLLVDHDTVEIENMSSQGWKESQLGKFKVQAAAEECHEINSKYGLPSPNSGQNIEIVRERFGRRSPRELGIGEDPKVLDCLFSCVDSIATRKLIYESVQPLNVPLIVDGRMALSSFQVLSSNTAEERAYYEKKFFSEEDAHRPVGQCTVQSTLHIASSCAALMVEAYSKFIQGKRQSKHVGIDFLSMDMTWEIDV